MKQRTAMKHTAKKHRTVKHPAVKKHRTAIILCGVLLATMLILTACAEEDPLPGLTLDMIDVKITAEPQPIERGEPVKIKAEVTLHGERVEADKIWFDVWQEGHEDNKEVVSGEREELGLYYITKTFEEDGVYYAISHVDYGMMHNMPRLKLVVGNVPGEDPIQEQVELDSSMMD